MSALTDRLRRLRDRGAAPEPHPDLVRITDEDRRYLTTLHDERAPLPPGAAEELSRDNPRLLDLRRRYAALDLPALAASRWSDEAVQDFLDLRFFRGETLITWHYRELPRISALKFFVLAQHVAGRDTLGLLDRLTEDGAFGCWTYTYAGHPPYSRDLLESACELLFLERRLGVSRRSRLGVLDIGAGYGRLAHRLAEAFGPVVDVRCVDAVPESTFLAEYYLRHRGVDDRAQVVPLDRVADELEPGTFDLATNIHSFSEMPYEAVAWWVSELERLEVPRLLVVPNEPDELLTLEADGTRRDFAPLLHAAGFALEHREPVIDDPAVRELLPLADHFHLFARR